MFQVTIVNAGIENFQVTQYCVIADDYREAGEIALGISGKKNHIKIIDIKKYLIN